MKSYSQPSTVHLPLLFEANRGQYDSDVLFVARSSGSATFITRTGIIMPVGEAGISGMRGATEVRMVLAGGRASEAEGEGLLPGRANYFLTDDQSAWRTNVPLYDRVVQRSVYPKTDLILHGDGDRMEYDFVLHPSGDPSRIRVRFTGVERVELTPEGNLRLQTATGEVQQRNLRIFQPGLKEQTAVRGKFVQLSEREVGFEIGDYDQTKDLVVDPALVYATYTGGPGPMAIYKDPVSGKTQVYVAGSMTLLNPPTTTQFGPPLVCNTCGLYIAKIDPSLSGSASLLYFTVVSNGSVLTNGNFANGLGLDAQGNAYLTGAAVAGFPLVQPYQSVIPSGGSAPFLLKLSSNGSQLLYSTLLGDNGCCGIGGTALAVTTDGAAYVVGTAASIPLLNPFSTVNTTGIFAAILKPDFGGAASLLYSTYVGGSLLAPCGGSHQATGVAIGPSGTIYLIGDTTQSSFPIKNGFLFPAGCMVNAGVGFFAKLDPSRIGWDQLLYSTALNPFDGQGNYPWAYGVTTNGAGHAFIATYNGYMEIDPSWSGSGSLIASRTLPFAYPGAITLDSSGNVWLAGSAGTGFPVLNPMQPSINGVYQGLSGGATWSVLPGLSISSVSAIAVDASTSPRTLYVGTGAGCPDPGAVYKSTDGGLSWTTVTGLPTQQVRGIVVDSTNPSTIYVGMSPRWDCGGIPTAGSGIYKSADGGATWSLLSQGLDATVPILKMVGDGSTVYALTENGLLRLTPNTSNWSDLNRIGRDLAIDTRVSPHALYVINEFDPPYRSTDSGNSWVPLNGPNGSSGIAVDVTTTPTTVYLTNFDGQDGSIMRSRDGGNTWEDIGHPPSSLGGVTSVDTSVQPVILYFNDPTCIWRYIDGQGWTALFCPGGDKLGTLTLDRVAGGQPATVYVGSANPIPAAFVAEIRPGDGAVLFSAIFGGSDAANGSYADAVALDDSGNIYVAGLTYSTQFPLLNGLQTSPDFVRTGNGSVGGYFIKLGDVAVPLSAPGCGANCTVTAQVEVATGSMSISFPQVTGSSGGTSTLSVTPVSTAQAANYSLSNNLGAFNISTTATYVASATNPIVLCVQANTVNDEIIFANLTLLHVVNGVSVDITSSRNFPSRTICGSTTSLSPFVLVKGAADQIADLIRYVNGLDLRKGIASSLDSKLQNASKAYTSAKSHDYASVCNMMSAFLSSVQAQTGQQVTAAEALVLTSSAKEVAATIGCH